MNAIRFKHFWFYLLDLHNLKVIFILHYSEITFIISKVEGKLRFLANPLVPARLEDILRRMEQKLIRTENKESQKEGMEVIIDKDKDDEVSIIFYDE